MVLRSSNADPINDHLTLEEQQGLLHVQVEAEMFLVTYCSSLTEH